MKFLCQGGCQSRLESPFPGASARENWRGWRCLGLEEIGGREKAGKGSGWRATHIIDTRPWVSRGRVALLAGHWAHVLLAGLLPFLRPRARLGFHGGLSDPRWNQRAVGPGIISLAFVISSLAGSWWQNSLSCLSWNRMWGARGSGGLPTCQPSCSSPLFFLNLIKWD